MLFKEFVLAIGITAVLIAIIAALIRGRMNANAIARLSRRMDHMRDVQAASRQAEDRLDRRVKALEDRHPRRPGDRRSYREIERRA